MQQNYNYCGPKENVNRNCLRARAREKKGGESGDVGENMQQRGSSKNDDSTAAAAT